MKIVKTPTPDFLRSNYKKWGKRYKAKRDNPNRSNNFAWATYKKQKVNHLLLPIFRDDVNNAHCSFCDGSPLDTTGETIEHLRCVSKFPLLSYVWGNLYYCCNYCNNHKLENPEKKLLRPDKVDYEFEKYFIFDYETGEIEVTPDPNLSALEKEKAVNTINIYGLNKFNRPKRRKGFLKLFQKTTEPNIEDFPYRFILQ